MEIKMTMFKQLVQIVQNKDLSKEEVFSSFEKSFNLLDSDDEKLYLINELIDNKSLYVDGGENKYAMHDGISVYNTNIANFLKYPSNKKIMLKYIEEVENFTCEEHEKFDSDLKIKVGL